MNNIPRIMLRTTALLTLMLACLAITGCMHERVVRDGWADFAAKTGADVGGMRPFGEEGAAGYFGPQGGGNQNGPVKYGINLQTFIGHGRVSKAQQLMQSLREEQKMSDFWIEDINGTTTVFYGNFESQASEEAIEKLANVRALEVDGRKPFKYASMQPLSGKNKVKHNPLDLRSYEGYMSLQVAAYTSEFGDEFRHAAEKAAKQIRKDGDEAYFYHGPYKSLVCVGLFTDEDFIETDTGHGFTERGYGPRIKELQKKFPHNLVNGVTVKQSVGGKDIGDQESFVVNIIRTAG